MVISLASTSETPSEDVAWGSEGGVAATGEMGGEPRYEFLRMPVQD